MRPVFRVSSLAVLILLITAIACYDAIGPASGALPSVASIAVQPLQASVTTGKTIAFNAVALDPSGNPINDMPVTWTSQDTTVASVSTTGSVTAKRPGSTLISASTGEKTAGAALTVLPPKTASVQLSPASINITPGDTIRLSTTLQDSAQQVITDGRKVEWVSSDTTVAKVSTAGLVTGVAKGSASVVATSDGVSDTTGVTVTITPPAVASVSVTPSSKTLLIGSSVQLSATAKDASGNALAGRTMTWATSNASVATVSASGLVKGVSVGTSTVTATTGGKQGAVAITVTVPSVATVTVSPASVNLQINATQQLAATLKDAAGNVLSGRSITWTSSNETTATVSSSGLVTARATGSAIITASSGGKSATSNITVPTSGTPTHAGWYVSPSGSASGDGSAARPWDLVTALAAPTKVQPGDTIWLRGGSYGQGDDINRPIPVRLTGTQSQPIIVRQYPGERATVNGNLEVTGAYVWLWGFEIANTNTSSSSYTAIGVSSHGVGCRFINLVIHDHAGDGIGLWEEGPNQEAYGNIIYNNGFHGNNSSATAHGIYAQNATGTKRLADNLIFNQSGYGIHIYGQSGALVGFTIEGNAVANNSAQILVGGSTPADAIVVRQNMTYSTQNNKPGIWLGHDQSTQNATMSMTDNYIGNGYPSIRLYNWTNATVKGNIAYSPGGNGSMTDVAGSVSGWSWSGNTYYGDPSQQSWLWTHSGKTDGFDFSGWKTATGFTTGEAYLGSTPPNTIFVRPNEYEAGRANVVVYNWAGQGSVNVDVSHVLTVGSHYEVRDVLNFYGQPVTSGTYAGGSITVPMVSTQGPASITGGQIPATGPTFGMFVVLTTK